MTSFQWMYNAQPSPGMRTWTLDASNRWHEVYPDGKEAKLFDVVIRGVVNGCGGSLASISSDAFLDVFIPDRGCAEMVALFRRDNGAWRPMGVMQNIR